MHIQHAKYHLLFCFLILAVSSCNSNGAKEEPAGEKKTQGGTPVTVTTISMDTLTEYTYLNATATFLQKSYVKANVNGYVQAANAALGQHVVAGQVLFTVKTKESQSIGNAVNKLDPDFKFSGVNNIKAGGSGYITQLNHQAGDYVQDGEQLAVINDENSFAFLLNLPYELKQYLQKNNNVALLLPDGTTLNGVITASMPLVDPGSQTQSVVIKVPGGKAIPENLVAKVKIVKVNKPHAQSLPKAAVLTNDTQSDFWVMMMIDSNTAAKVPVKKGVETNDKVEIAEPKFSDGDKILLTGNYGLPDTAKVTIQQKSE